MTDYAYSPQLHPPQKTADIDVTRPGTKIALKILAKTHRQQTAGFVPPPGIRLRQECLGGVPCFVIEPENAGALPGMLYCHGGGFYLPAQVSSLKLACIYAKETPLRVYLPEYSLTPDSPAPRALEECRAVQQAVSPELVYGESAGAAIAAMLDGCLGQMLIYPATDDRSARYPSIARYDRAVWTAASNQAMWSAYLGALPESALPGIVPMRRESLRSASPAYIETQEFDILRDEGAAFAQRLREAEVPVVYRMIPGSYHGFDGELETPLVRRALAQRLDWLRGIIEKRSEDRA